LNRYTSGKFTGQFKATIGADCVSKEVLVVTANGSSIPVTLQLWDTAGQERFQSLGVAFYRNSDAAILVYDVTDPVSWDHVTHWKHEFLLQQSSPAIPIFVLGNKVDKKPRMVPMNVAEEWCRRNGISYYLETSAKTAANVDDGFCLLATAAWEHHERNHQHTPPFIPPPPSVELNRRPRDDYGKHPDPCC
jgi:Ras-related protein Rab-7A